MSICVLCSVCSCVYEIATIVTTTTAPLTKLWESHPRRCRRRLVVHMHRARTRHMTRTSVICQMPSSFRFAVRTHVLRGHCTHTHTQSGHVCVLATSLNVMDLFANTHIQPNELCMFRRTRMIRNFCTFLLCPVVL